MGKITGFMEYERLEEAYQPVQLRLKNYNEVAIGLKEDEARIQSAVVATPSRSQPDSEVALIGVAERPASAPSAARFL